MIFNAPSSLRLKPTVIQMGGSLLRARAPLVQLTRCLAAPPLAGDWASKYDPGLEAGWYTWWRQQGKAGEYGREER